MKEYFLAKKAAKAQLKQQKAIEQLETRENERLAELLVDYFDHHGKSLTADEIKKVNNYLKEYVVLTDEQEINNYATLMLTYSTVAKRKLADIIEELKIELDNGQVLSKTEAAMIAKNIIIRKPCIETTTIVNGKMQSEVVYPEKKYIVNIDLNSQQPIQNIIYEQESEEGRKNIDNQIKRWEKVQSCAYVGYKDNYCL